MERNVINYIQSRRIIIEIGREAKARIKSGSFLKSTFCAKRFRVYLKYILIIREKSTKRITVWWSISWLFSGHSSLRNIILWMT